MIHIKFKQLFDVEVLHDFYKSGRSNDFDFIPSDDCLTLIKNFGLKFRESDSGFSVYAETDTVNPGDLIRKPIPENTCFRFFMKLKNPDFVNFSNVQLNKNPLSFYYFNNLTQNISADSKPLLLSNVAGKQVSDTDIVTKAGNIYSFHHTSVSATQTGELRMRNNDQKISQELKNNDDNFDFSLQTNSLPEGRAQFFVEGVLKDDFYLLNKSESEDFYALIEIFHRNALSNEYKFQTNANAIDTKFYKIKFANRKTTWRYIINNKFGNALADPGVKKVNGNSINFTKDIAAPANQLIFFSNAELALQEEPVTGIKLLKDKNDNTSALIENLPNPKTSLLNKFNGDPKIYSDIILTI